MKLKLLVVSFGLAASGVVFANTYQSEVGATAARWDENGANHTVNNHILEGKYYFNLVNTANLPLAEAAYLNKSSNVFAALSRNFGKGNSTDFNKLLGGVEVYIPENFLYVKVEASRSKFDSYSNHDSTATIGITPLDGLRVTTSWELENSYDANISAKYVTAIGSGQFINAEATVADTSFGTYKAIGGDFYIDTSFSVGAEVSDDDMGTNYTARTRKFFGEQWSGNFSYTDAEYGNKVAVGVDFRF